MKPLVDADILLYEIGHSGEFKDASGETIINSFDNVAALLDKKINIICEDVDATEEPTIYITGDEKLVTQLARYPLDRTESPAEYRENFRIGVATTKGYKATRKSSKPFHFYNLRAYIVANYQCKVSCAWEADDQMAMDQTYQEKLIKVHKLEYGDTFNTIICSRDKDLRMVPGYHFSWECGRQAAIGPIYIGPDEIGWLEMKDDGKVIGYGPMFFYYQLLMGDVVDNIPGCKGVGTKGAYYALVNAVSELDMFQIVKEFYKEKHSDNSKEYFMEQAYLLWMVQERDVEGNLVMWKPPIRIEVNKDEGT